MVKHLQTQAESIYGTPQGLVNQFPAPIVSTRAPTTSDTGYVFGQFWINKTAGTFYSLVSNSAGIATWLSLGGSTTPSVAALSVAGAATVGSLVTSSATLGTTLTQNTWSGTGSNANINLVATPKGTGTFNVSTGNIAALNGNVTMGTAGNGLVIKEGANARMGTSAAMTAGSIVITNSSVTANTVIFLSPATTGGTQGALSSVPNPGVGFTINSSSATDTSTVNWLLIEKS
jgi:hypothetical protein